MRGRSDYDCRVDKTVTLGYKYRLDVKLSPPDRMCNMFPRSLLVQMTQLFKPSRHNQLSLSQHAEPFSGKHVYWSAIVDNPFPPVKRSRLSEWAPMVRIL